LAAANHAFAVAYRARRKILSRPSAARASHVELHSATGLLNRPFAMALWADARLFNVSAAVAMAADILPRDVQAHHASANRRPERHVHLIFEIAPRFRALLHRRPSAASTENAAEDIAEPAPTGARAPPTRAFEHVSEIEAAEVEASRPCPSSRLLSTRESPETTGSGRAATGISLGGCGIDVVGIEAQLVVDLPLFGIAENVVGFGNSLKSFLCSFVSGIDVRMIFPRKLAERLADVVRRGRLLYSEDFVIVLLASGR